jgi:hypothetical protein
MAASKGWLQMENGDAVQYTACAALSTSPVLEQCPSNRTSHIRHEAAIPRLQNEASLLS